jgi:acetyltransferase-like isoleucine patch superfamily enzyme
MQKVGINAIGENVTIFDPVIIGFPSRDKISEVEFKGASVGNNSILRAGTIIYCDVDIGENFSSGHNVLIREKTRIGKNVSIGSGSIIEGNCSIGNNCNIQSMVFIPTNTEIGEHVFIGPHTTLTNDKYPPTGKPRLIGPLIEDFATIGGNSTILPGIRISSGSAVAAGSVVTRDVPPGMIAIGNPARLKKIPPEMIHE